MDKQKKQPGIAEDASAQKMTLVQVWLPQSYNERLKRLASKEHRTAKAQAEVILMQALDIAPPTPKASA